MYKKAVFLLRSKSIDMNDLEFSKFNKSKNILIINL